MVNLLNFILDRFLNSEGIVRHYKNLGKRTALVLSAEDLVSVMPRRMADLGYMTEAKARDAMMKMMLENEQDFRLALGLSDPVPSSFTRQIRLPEGLMLYVSDPA